MHPPILPRYVNHFSYSRLMGGPPEDLILAVDIGTTNVRAAVTDRQGKFLAIAFEPIIILSPQPGYSEICPEDLFKKIVRVIKKVVAGKDERIRGMGISVQRNTFVTWDAKTGKYNHNFITWLDTRTSKFCEAWNNSYLTMAGKWMCWGLGKVTGSRHLICASTYCVREAQIQPRLKWVLENIPKAKEQQKTGQLRFGTMETWLVWKLTNKRVWATDHSCASGTGIFDLWKGVWCPNMTYIFGIPCDILPEVRDTNAFYGNTEATILGVSIPICGVIGDQQASCLGNQLFNTGDIKLTMGTGIVADVNTGDKMHPTCHNMYPNIGWKFVGEKSTYIAEILSSNGGRSMNWAIDSGMLSDVTKSSDVAKSVQDSGGVAFIPAFHGMQIPVIDRTAATSLFGITPSTCTKHIVRAILESQAFTSKYILDTTFASYGKPAILHVDGGVSQADFIVECVVSLCDISIARSESVEGSLLGAAFAAGLGCGLWKSTDDIVESVRMKETIFDQRDFKKLEMDSAYSNWIRAASKCQNWYDVPTSQADQV